MEDGLVPNIDDSLLMSIYVLILVVVDDGLVQKIFLIFTLLFISLNPYCNGRWSRTFSKQSYVTTQIGLNPCCDGRWSRTACYKWEDTIQEES